MPLTPRELTAAHEALSRSAAKYSQAGTRRYLTHEAHTLRDKLVSVEDELAAVRTKRCARHALALSATLRPRGFWRAWQLVRRCDTELADKIRAQMRLIEQSARDQATGPAWFRRGAALMLAVSARCSLCTVQHKPSHVFCFRFARGAPRDHVHACAAAAVEIVGNACRSES